MMTTDKSNSVLVVEDSKIYERIIQNHLRSWGFQVTLAGDGEEAWEILQQPNSPRLVIMDWVMPKMDGVELCRRIRRLPSPFPYTYTLILTAKDSQADLLKAMDAGVDDFLAKPFDELELKARLFAGKRIIDLQNHLLAARESLRHAASHDSLTGLMNRREIMDSLQREMARAKRERTPLSIALVDIDHFKSVNDEMGHLFGDEVLKEVGKRFQAKLRLYDFVGRYGGEEFLLICPGCDWTSAHVRMDAIRESVCSAPMSAMGKYRKVTTSIGIATWDQTDELNVNVLLNRADHALYEAKRNGRNRVHQAPNPSHFEFSNLALSTVGAV